MADQPGLLPQPQQPQDQGLLGGLLNWLPKYDPVAAYQGALTDPATQDALRVRALGGMAQAMGRAAMPVPYKGGMPWGSFLGEAAGGAVSGEDALINARLQNAQAENQRITGLLSQQRLGFLQAIAPQAIDQYLHPEKYTGAAGAGGQPGKPGAPNLMDRARAAAGGIGGDNLYSFLRTFDYPGVAPATPQEAAFLTGNAKIESSFAPDTEHDAAFLRSKGLPPGYGLWGDNADRLAAMRKDSGVGPNDPVPWQQQAIWQLQELRKSKQGASVNAATTPEQMGNLSIDYLRPDTKQNDGFRAERGAAIGAYMQSPPGTQTAAAPPAPAAPAEPPMAPSAAPPSLLSPQGAARAASSAATPQLMPPPAAAPPAAAPPPGPQGALPGRPPPGLLAMAAPQTMNDASSAASQLLGGPAGAQLAQAGGGAPQPSAASPAPVPHTGAAGAAELQGLINQPPPAAAPAQPAGGPGGPGTPPGAAPVPAAPPMPPAPPSAPPVPPMPQQGPIPGAPTPEQIVRSTAATKLFPLVGIPVSPLDAEIAKYPMAGPTAQATAAGTAAGQAPYNAYNEQLKAQYQLWVEQNKPQIVRPGSYVRDPTTGQMVWNPPVQKIIDPKTGAEWSYYVYPPATADGLPRWVPIGQTGLGPGATSRETTRGRIGAENEPVPAPQQPAPAPGAPQYQGTRLTGPMDAPTSRSAMPNYREPLWTEKQLSDNGKNWADGSAELQSSIGLGQYAEQRLQVIAQAYKMIDTGAWTTEKAQFNALLGSVFGDGAKQFFAASDPTAVEGALHAMYKQTLQSLAAVNKRFTGQEFKINAEYGENPNVQPGANLQMLADDIGVLRQSRALAMDWSQAQQRGYQDPQMFETNWRGMKENQLGPIVEGVKREIGPLGLSNQPQTIPSDLPKGTTYGGVQNGRTYYVLPDGKTTVWGKQQ